MTIPLRNFAACAELSRDTLGFKVKDTDEGFISFEVGGHEFASMGLAGAAQMISEEVIQPDKEGAPRLLYWVFLENADEACEELKGVEFTKPPTTQPWGQRTPYFADPDANIWEISHFEETTE